MLKGLQLESPHIFNTKILFFSWPWALFGSRLLIIWTLKTLFFTYIKQLNKVSGRGPSSAKHNEFLCTPSTFQPHWQSKSAKLAQNISLTLPYRFLKTLNYLVQHLIPHVFVIPDFLREKLHFFQDLSQYNSLYNISDMATFEKALSTTPQWKIRLNFFSSFGYLYMCKKQIWSSHFIKRYMIKEFCNLIGSKPFYHNLRTRISLDMRFVQ